MSTSSAHRPTMAGRLRGVGAFVAWATSLLAAAVTTLPGGRIEQRLTDLPPEAAPIATAVRLAVLVAALYLLGVTALALVREAGGAARSRRLGRWGSPAVVHRLAAAAVGTSIAAGIVGPAGSSTVAAAPSAVEVPADEPGDREVAVLTHLGPGGDGAGHSHHTPTTPEQQPHPAGAPVEEWPVEPGDHLWRVAERTLEAAWGRGVTDAEVHPYWREVVAANRSRLVDATNPDLILPGQQLVVPPPPAPPPQAQ